MVKYKQQVIDMFTVHEFLFKEFKKIHDAYVIDPHKWQEAFNEKGREIIPVLARWENSLCSKSESGKYGKFSSTLADKFRNEVKVHFPKIDHIGMKVK
ncbi:MAG TPA: hypothetical protein VNW29_03540 [Candidatus Sulfotelmatobacter sp.]|jgi:hypothetical protein|nr:hypothetical protein [Candidatus Sulfotelmatobacter sp.]